MSQSNSYIAKEKKNCEIRCNYNEGVNAFNLKNSLFKKEKLSNRQ